MEQATLSVEDMPDFLSEAIENTNLPIFKFVNDGTKEQVRMELIRFPEEVTSTQFGEKIQHRYEVLIDGTKQIFFASSRSLQGQLGSMFRAWSEVHDTGDYGLHPLVEVTKRGKDKDRVYGVRLMAFKDFITIKAAE